MERCGEHENIASSHAVTHFDSKDVQENTEAKKKHNGVIMKLYDGGDLQGKTFEGSALVKHALGAAKGLLAMHDAELAHRDVKPENMILDDETVKIFDFGTVIDLKEEIPNSDDHPLKQTTRNTSGSPAYFPPECEDFGAEISNYEMKNSTEFIQKRDVYALGVSLFEMQTELEGDDLKAQTESLTSKLEEFIDNPDNATTPLNKFILRMLVADPEKRPTMKEVVGFLNALQLIDNQKEWKSKAVTENKPLSETLKDLIDNQKDWSPKEVFKNPILFHAIKSHFEAQLSAETFLFMERAYSALETDDATEFKEQFQAIYNEFIKEGSENQINIGTNEIQKSLEEEPIDMAKAKQALKNIIEYPPNTEKGINYDNMWTSEIVRAFKDAYK